MYGYFTMFIQCYFTMLHNSPGFVNRPTTVDYRQLSSLESSSRGESESLSNGSHRHSLFSGSSTNYRNVVGGDDISDILLQGGGSGWVGMCLREFTSRNCHAYCNWHRYKLKVQRLKRSDLPRCPTARLIDEIPWHRNRCHGIFWFGIEFQNS